jgi:diacylglycerol kinase (ATP)
MKTLAVINPRSAGGRTRREADTIARRLAEVSGPLSVALTEGPLDASRITSRGLLEGFERIVAVGGDGTINEVVNGFFHEGAVINPEAELCLLNMGTGGDFRKTFEIGIGLDAALQRMTEGPVRRIDAGCLTYVAPDGRTGTRYFANIASFGLSGDVVERVNSARLLKRVTGQFAYTWASLSALVRFRPKPVRLKVDDVFDDVVTISTCAVCNGQYFGGGMKVAPGASPDDGLFDVVVMGAAPLKQTLSSMNDIFTGEHVNNPNVRVLRGRRVIATPVEATEGAPIHIEADGESPGRLPAMFEVRARALKFRG